MRDVTHFLTPQCPKLNQKSYLPTDTLENIIFISVFVLCLVIQLHLTLCDPMVCEAHQDLLSTGFSRQEYWSGLP